MNKPDINMADAYWAEEQDWCVDSHFMPTTGTYKIVVKDANSTMGIRYFENEAELQAWVKTNV